MSSQDFDWYISPADRFTYETQFSKYSKDEKQVTLPQLEPLFSLSRLAQEEFLQIWNLVDIRVTKSVNKEQFIYFMHILNSRRRGRVIPVGVPLYIKEQFLKDEVRSNLYTRPAQNAYQQVVNVTPASQDEVDVIEEEIKQTKREIDATTQKKNEFSDKLSQVNLIQSELQGLLNYKKKYLSALEDCTRELTSKNQQFYDPFNGSAEDLSSLEFEFHDCLKLLEERRQKLLKELNV